MTRGRTQSEIFQPVESDFGRLAAARQLPNVLRVVAVLGSLLLVSGCALTDKTQLAECQDEKRQLLSRVVDEQRRSESLQGELKVSNQRLAEAEKQLARSFGTRGSSPLLASGDLSGPVGTGYRTAESSRSSDGGGERTGPVTNDPSITRQVQLGAPRDVRSWNGGSGLSGSVLSGGGSVPSGEGASGSGFGGGGASGGPGVGAGNEAGQRDGTGLEIVGPQNSGGPSGWLPRSVPRQPARNP
jgi:hypothetical protein